MRSFVRACRSVLSRTRFEREMRDELRGHIAHRADDLVASGMLRDEAVRRARVEFGALEAYKEECRDASGFARVRPLHGLTADLKLAVRRLAAAPVFTVFAVLSIALGVGVTTAVYSVVDSNLWRTSVIRDSRNVVVLKTAEAVPSMIHRVLSQPDFHDIRAAQSTLAEIGASFALSIALQTDSRTEMVRAEAVDGEYFRTLGLHASRGRLIESDDVRSYASVAVLNYSVWVRRFQSDPAIVGRVVRLSGRPFEIVGIAPEDFGGPTQGLQQSSLWVPSSSLDLLAPQGPTSVPERERPVVMLVGRLRPGVPLESAAREIAALGNRLDSDHPRTRRYRSGGPIRRGWTLKPIEETNREAVMMARIGLLLVSLATLVLIVACTNLANLVLARGALRVQEIAVRQALGATRWRLVREQLAETTILALLGGVGAYVVLALSMQLLDIELPTQRFLSISLRPQVNATALAAAAGALLLALTVFGVEPALALTRRKAIRGDLTSAASAGAPSTRRQRVLLRAQVAVSAGLFIIASLFVRHVVAAARHDPGLDMDRMAVAVVNLMVPGWDTARVRRTVERLQEPGKVPQLEAIAVSSGLPFGMNSSSGVILSTTDRPIGELVRDQRGLNYETAAHVAASPGYFRATGTALLRGRDFELRDDAAAPPVAILCSATAHALFGTTDIIGRQFLARMDASGRSSDKPVETMTVIGVAEDTDSPEFMSRRTRTVYLPLKQTNPPPILAVIGRARTTDMAVGGISAAIRAADPDAPIRSIGSGQMVLSGPHAFLRSAATLALSLGGLTLVLAMAGLYGIQSHVVAHRTREIGRADVARRDSAADQDDGARAGVRAGHPWSGGRRLHRGGRARARPIRPGFESGAGGSLDVPARARAAAARRVLRLLLPGAPGVPSGPKRCAATPVSRRGLR
jgi:macrolide transport system ATP-binding/permease protein